MYGHLAEIDPEIWVGKIVTSETQLGVLGNINERHLHIQVHSYGENIAVDHGNEIDYTGILPVNGNTSGMEIVAPYLYDLIQFLPSVKEEVVTSSLVPTPPANQVGATELELATECSRTYISDLPVTGTTIKEAVGYRGVIIYGVLGPLPSPLATTNAPTPGPTPSN